MIRWIWIFILAGTLAGGCGEGETERATKPTEPSTTTAEPEGFVLNPQPRRQWLSCAVLVNDARFIRLDRGSPLYAQCLFNASAVDAEIALPDVVEMALRVTNTAGEQVRVKWQPLGLPAGAVQAGQTSRMAWLADRPLPAGQYRLSVSLPEDYTPAGGLSGTQVHSAAFTMLDTPPSDYRNAMFARRVKTLAGQIDDVLAELEELSAVDPADNSLRLELVDALDAAGKTQDARRQLLKVIAHVTHDDAGNKTSPVPPSLAFRLEELNGRLAARTDSMSSGD
jgi:hypothetical protein